MHKLCFTGMVLLAFAIVGALPSASSAATKYWDIDGATAGAGGSSPAGTWDTTLANWSTDSTGASAGTTWVAGDTAVFSAGTDATGSYQVTLGANQTAAGIVVEEGTVVIGPTNAVTLGAGSVMVNSGATLETNSSARISTTAGSVYTLNGGTLRTTNTGAAGSFIDVDSTISLGAAGGTLDYQVTNVLNIVQSTTVISGPGSLTKTGPGVLAIASPSTYLGDTIVNDGELRMRSGLNRLPTTTNLIVNNTGIFNLNGSAQNQTVASISGNGQIGLSGGTITVNGSSTTIFSGQIKNVANAGAAGATSGNGRLTKDGTGTLTLNGINDFKGRTTVVNGELIVAPGAILSDAIADLYIDGGKLTLNNAAQTIENLSTTTSGVSTGTLFLGPGHTLTTDPSSGASVATLTFAAKISGPGNLVKANVLAGATAKTATLTGNNDYTGTTLISGGRIAVGSPTALGSTAGDTTVASGAELLFDGAAVNFSVAEPLKIAGPGIGTSSAGAINVQSGATPTLTGPISLTGDATINVSGSSGLTIANTASITSTANESLTLGGGAGAGAGGVINSVITLNSGSLIKNNGGQWALTGANIYTGGTTINSGTLYANNTIGSATGTGTVTVVDGATLGGNGSVGGPTTVDGTLAPGMSVGTLSFANTVDIGPTGIFLVEYDSTAQTIDLAAISGTLSISGGTVNFADLGAGTLNLASYVFATFASGGTRSFTAMNVPTGYNLVDSGTSLALVAAVPEASAFLFGGAACALAAAVHRRRRTK